MNERERRAHVRYAPGIQETATIRRVDRDEDIDEPALLVDVSRGGVSLVVRRRRELAEGDALRVVAGALGPCLVEVRWVRPHDAETERIGCRVLEWL